MSKSKERPVKTSAVIEGSSGKLRDKNDKNPSNLDARTPLSESATLINALHTEPSIPEYITVFSSTGDFISHTRMEPHKVLRVDRVMPGDYAVEAIKTNIPVIHLKPGNPLEVKQNAWLNMYELKKNIAKDVERHMGDTNLHVTSTELLNNPAIGGQTTLGPNFQPQRCGYATIRYKICNSQGEGVAFFIQQIRVIPNEETKSATEPIPVDVQSVEWKHGSTSSLIVTLSRDGNQLEPKPRKWKIEIMQAKTQGEFPTIHTVKGSIDLSSSTDTLAITAESSHFVTGAVCRIVVEGSKPYLFTIPKTEEAQ